MEGTIKKLFEKGYGFIEAEGYGLNNPDEKNLFFHAAGLKKGYAFNDLKLGDKVGFESVEETQKGLQAVGVYPVKEY